MPPLTLFLLTVLRIYHRPMEYTHVNKWGAWVYHRKWMFLNTRSLRYTHDNYILYSTYLSPESNIQNNCVFVTCKYFSFTWNIKNSHIIIHLISIQLILRLSSYFSKKFFWDFFSESAFLCKIQSEYYSNQNIFTKK